MKFPIKLLNIFHHTLSMFSHYLVKFNNSNLLQIWKKMQTRKFDFWTHLVLLHMTYILIVWFNFWFGSKQLLPVVLEVSGQFFIFQHDNAQHTGTRHCATSRAGNYGVHSTGSLFSDLNPVDYRIWSVVQQRVYQSRVHNTDELKQCRSNCGATSTRASLTVQLTSVASVFVHACRRTADTSSKCCRKQFAYLYSTVWQHCQIRDTFWFFFCCNFQ